MYIDVICYSEVDLSYLNVSKSLMGVYLLPL